MINYRPIPIILEEILDELKKLNGNKKNTPKVEIRDANNKSTAKKGKDNGTE